MQQQQHSKDGISPSISSVTGSPTKRKPTQTERNPKELLLSVQTVVKNRTGAVLARQLILKSDHFDTAVNTRLDFNLHGAPNVIAKKNIFFTE